MSQNKELFKLLMAITRLRPVKHSYYVNRTVTSIEYNPSSGFTTIKVYYGGKHHLTATVKGYSSGKENSIETMLYFIKDKRGFAEWLRLKYITFLLSKVLAQVISELYDGQATVGDTDLYIERTLSLQGDYHG